MMKQVKTISILGSGWLGLPLAQQFSQQGYSVKLSTTTESRVASLATSTIEPFILNIESLSKNTYDFLSSDYLIVNIPSKNIDAFSSLLREIEKSKIQKILFVSSTSVYIDNNKTITEEDCSALKKSPLVEIENLFRHSKECKTTIVRFGGLIGYSRNPGRFFKHGRTVQNSDSTINLIHRDDCIGIISTILAGEVWGEVFNCCADTHPTKKEFYTQATQKMGEAPPNFSDSKTNTFKIISNKKVKEVLKYNFIHPDLIKITFP